MADKVKLDLPAHFLGLLDRGKFRYKVARGGRGSAKSWSFARALLILCLYEPLLVLCTREYQNSIQDSVHRLLSRQIEIMNLQPFFDVQQKIIRCNSSGAQFIFKGLHHNINEIRSMEGVDICWVEEGQSVSEESWRALIPTIRKENSEIWLSFNPIHPDDPTCKRFVEARPLPPRMLSIVCNWSDNPWFTEELNQERLHMLKTDPDAYDHVWGGHYLQITNAAVLRGSYVVEPFDTPERVDRFFFGADWGFAQDPTVLVRAFIKDDCLYVDHEAWGLNVDTDDIPAMFKGGVSSKNGKIWPGIPEVENWPIKADSARPETISYVRRHGQLNIQPADKWKGSVEDGIAHLKAFKKIIIHPRCIHVAEEARLYSYKVDRNTEEVLPIIVDKHNHCIDSLRYALDGYIQKRGNLGVWLRLGKQSANFRGN